MIFEGLINSSIEILVSQIPWFHGFSILFQSYRDYHADIFPETTGLASAMGPADWFEDKLDAAAPKINLDPKKRPKEVLTVFQARSPSVSHFEWQKEPFLRCYILIFRMNRAGIRRTKINWLMYVWFQEASLAERPAKKDGAAAAAAASPVAEKSPPRNGHSNGEEKVRERERERGTRGDVQLGLAWAH